MSVTIDGVDGLRRRTGEHVGYSDWLVIDQKRIDTFAEATDDRQWIHVDPEKAAQRGPYGSTIAHGFLTVSLVPHLLSQVVQFRGIRMGVNYGFDKVRFPAPVPVDAAVRLGAEIRDVEDKGEDAVQVRWLCTIEIRDEEKPACVAELLFRYYG